MKELLIEGDIIVDNEGHELVYLNPDLSPQEREEVIKLFRKAWVEDYQIAFEPPIVWYSKYPVR